MKIAFNPSTVEALITPPNNKDITFDLRGHNIFARGVKFCGTDTNTWRDIKINNVSIGSNILDLRDGDNTTLTNINGIVTINSTWRPVVDNLTSDSTTSSLSANLGRILKALIDGKSDSDHNHDDRYVKKTGDTMFGALNFANGTWNLVGDDSYMGDCNISGHFGIKAANTTYPGIAFFNNANDHLGNLTAYNGNIKYGAYSLQFLDNGNTSVSASTWMNPFSTYNASAVADGQAICVWGQSSSLSNLAADSGDMSLWLKRVNANVATLNMVLDGEYYANGNLRLAHVSEIPNSLKNPYALTISLNGTSQGPYDGSAAKNINITPSSIGAATSDHNHDSSYVKYTKVTKSTADNANATPYLYNVEDEEVISGYYKYWYIFNMGQYSGGNYGTLIAMPYEYSLTDSELFIRSANSGSWRTWRRILHSNNYASILDSRYYTESEIDSLLDAKLNRQNLSYGTWNPRGYNLAADYLYNGGDLSISESGGLIHVSVDGYFWLNEGLYRVLDTSDVAGFLRWKGMLNIGSNAPFQAVVDIIKDTSKLNDGGLSFYSYAGDEYTVLIGSRNDATRHGNALKWGYANKYLWMIRMFNGSPKSSDWEKISAGYADSSGNADTVDGLHVHSGRNNEANKIVRTDANGYILAGWINTTSGDMGTTTATRIYCSNDAYIRYKTLANFSSDIAGQLYWANVKVSTSSNAATSPTFGSLWINNSHFFKLSGTTFTCQGGTTFTLPSSSLNTNTALLWTTASDGARDTGIFYNSSDFAFIANSNDHGAVFAVYDTDVTQDFEAGAREISVPGSGGALWARGGFSKNGSSNDYVLLGGGDHKLESALNVANADTVDGYHSSSFLTKHTREGAYNIDHLTDFVTRDLQPKSEINIEGTKPYDGWGIVTVLKTDNGTAQLVFDGGNNFYFRSSYGTENRYVTSAWKQVANLSSNVSSATKLQTPRNIWGQPFDGTRDIPISVAAKMPLVFFKRFDNDETAGYVGCGSSSNNNIYIESYVNSNIILGLSNSNVGIGINSPSYKLDVNGWIGTNGIYTNRTGSSTDGGVSLYSNVDPMTYGIAFRGTGTYRTHGYVTSANDWATYLTMDDNTTRGWIFRRGDTNVASIAGSGNMAIGLHLEFSNGAHISTNRSTDYHYGYTFNLGYNAKSIGMYSGPSGEAGGVVISPDGCLIYNSSDCDYNLQVRDKDLGSDLTNIDTLTFGIEQSGYYAWSRGGFKKNGSDDSYVLLGGGGHKAISDFASSSHSHNYAANENYEGFTKSERLPISGFYQSTESESGGNAPWTSWMHLINCLHSNTNNNYALLIAASFYDNNTFKIRVTNDNVNNNWRNIIHSGNIGSQSVNYANSAGNADKLDGYHANGSNVAPYGHIPTIESDGVMEVGKYIDFHNDNSGEHDFSTRLQSTDNHGNSVYLPSASGTLALTSDIPTVTNYYWANVKISASSSTTTSPTVYTLTATRVCAGHNPEIDNSISCSNWFRSSGATGWYNTTYLGGWYMSDTSWIRAHNNVGIYTGGQIYSSSSIKMNDILLEHTNEINSASGLGLNLRSPGDIVLCYGGGNVGVGTAPLCKLDVSGLVRAYGFHYKSVDSNDYMLLAGGGYMIHKTGTTEYSTAVLFGKYVWLTILMYNTISKTQVVPNNISKPTKIIYVLGGSSASGISTWYISTDGVIYMMEGATSVVHLFTTICYVAGN